MSTLITGSIRVDKLPKEKFIMGKDGAVYYNFTISVQDETRYGNNVAFMDSQTKEERDAKVQKNYLGNGKVVWTDGNITLLSIPFFLYIYKIVITLREYK